MPRRRSGKKIDFVHWTGVQESFVAQGSGLVAATVFSAQHESETLLRFRGNIACFVDGAQASGGLVHIGLGMLVVPEGTGTTVLSRPLTEPDSPWFWYESFTLAYEEMVVDAVQASGMSGFRAVIDSKAMRIVRNSEL